MAGSSFLNRRLEKYLRDSYRSPEGNGKDITTKLGYNLEELMAIMDAKFEEAKTSGIGFVLGKPLRLIVDCKSVSGVKQELEEHTFKVEWYVFGSSTLSSSTHTDALSGSLWKGSITMTVELGISLTSSTR